jgi:hypothetical protein
VSPQFRKLTKTQARELIRLCRQAPFGKGTETVVDTSVRRSWTLDPDQFRLTNPKWDDLVATIVEACYGTPREPAYAGVYENHGRL